MKTLYSYINNIKLIDGHIHLFDHSGTIMDNKYYKTTIYNQFDKIVGFMDIDYENLDKYNLANVVKYYDNFISKYYDQDKMILLATGTNVETMIEVYKKYPHIIKGFGELKCYNYYKDIELSYGNLQWFEELCEFNKELCLPIYIHWYVYNNERFNELCKLISKYPNIPFVLCHFGVSPKRNFKKQYEFVKSLLLIYDNLYVDISYKVVENFIECPELAKLFCSRLLIGTDINLKSTRHNNNVDIFKKNLKLYNMLNLNTEKTLKNIFCI